MQIVLVQNLALYFHLKCMVYDCLNFLTLGGEEKQIKKKNIDSGNKNILNSESH